MCHPSLANDNLSGIGTAAFLAKNLSELKLRYSYRFLFIPGTIGAITWLSKNQENIDRIKHGLVLTGLGNPGGITYKKSRHGDAEIDNVAQYVLKNSGKTTKLSNSVPTDTMNANTVLRESICRLAGLHAHPMGNTQSITHRLTILIL